VRVSFLLVASLAAAVGLTGCNILNEGDPEIARVVLEAGSANVRLVVSNDFNALEISESGIGEIVVISSDTVAVSGTFEQRYTLGQRLRFYARAEAPDTVPVIASMEVYIDDDLRFSQTRQLDGGENAMEFVYVFANPII
jgi:hypothetical protein